MRLPTTLVRELLRAPSSGTDDARSGTLRTAPASLSRVLPFVVSTEFRSVWFADHSMDDRVDRPARTRSGGKMVAMICHCSSVRSIPKKSCASISPMRCSQLPAFCRDGEPTWLAANCGGLRRIAANSALEKLARTIKRDRATVSKRHQSSINGGKRHHGTDCSAYDLLIFLPPRFCLKFPSNAAALDPPCGKVCPARTGQAHSVAMFHNNLRG